MNKIRVLIVCQWPLGGIRTYIKYNYKYFPRDEFEISILANPAIESEALQSDMEKIGVNVIWSRPVFGRDFLGWRFREARRRDSFDIVHSQGFFSAFHVSLFNRFQHLPHIMTIHGVVEKKYLKGRFANLKRQVLQRGLSDVDVVVAVSDDIGMDVRNDLPRFDEKAVNWVTIHNGIDTSGFQLDYSDARGELRQLIGVDQSTFVFGFFGRFMPEKGLDYLIDATECIKKRCPALDNFLVMAMGSGDYETKYKASVQRKGLGAQFCFLPFQAGIEKVIQGCDVVVMPSVWEAFPILSSEVLCSGIPLIATNCIGLREAVKGTPAIVVSDRNPELLAGAMIDAMHNQTLKRPFVDYRPIAGLRFDVQNSAQKLFATMKQMLGCRVHQ